MKKIAFTLAEVLITLTIIGVIAALTIPNLMQSYKKHQIEASLKEAYSIISNTLKIASIQENLSQDDILANTLDQKMDWYLRANYLGDNYIKPYIKYNVVCATYKNSKDCPFVKGLKNTNEVWFHKTDGGQSAHNFQYFYKIELQNGMFLGFQTENTAPNFVRIVVDINGAKGPNKLAYDIFAFGANSVKYNKDRGIDNKGIYGISCSTGNPGCTEPIMKNGWKIPDDYPVKKF